MLNKGKCVFNNILRLLKNIAIYSLQYKWTEISVNRGYFEGVINIAVAQLLNIIYFIKSYKFSCNLTKIIFVCFAIISQA